MNDPVGYAVDVLGVTPTPDQAAIAPAILQPPYRVLVKSGHNVGKTYLAAWLVNWWYDTRDPGVVITTAPTRRDVADLLWTEVRLQRQRAAVRLSMNFAGPAAPEMRIGPDHYAKGYTAAAGESFQGRHRARMLFVFDEAEGVDGIYWQTAGTMFQPTGEHGFFAILNPTTTTSQSFQEERAVGPDGERKWRVFAVSSLTHPNVAVGLANADRSRKGSPLLSLPVPGAVTVEQVTAWMGDWFERVSAGNQTPADVEFPPGSGAWWRPGPLGEARVLGRRPSAGTYGVWSEQLWASVLAPNPTLVWAPGDLPEIGCDVARFGDDWTETHSRWGPVSLDHEAVNGWDEVRVAARLKEIAAALAARATSTRPRTAAAIDPKTIRIKVDDTGVGGGVVSILRADGYAVFPVNSSETANEAVKYQKVRHELWFSTVERAKAGLLSLADLNARKPYLVAKLEAQALAPLWWPDSAGRRCVEPKDETKRKLGRSPDGMDALNLAYYDARTPGTASWVDTGGRRNWRDRT
ncbi:putative terminase B protein [Fimbriiglobus ruber]|uniref:Putative terminase B protein n=2 Tax=Fimbriiglobus ruber TaxID=1908690 RepID=A0A225E4S9_9BACT|nr:putative terminase B protein [Fimbriiglobus ruber]